LPVLDREIWPDGTEVVWLASPFPSERKPVVPVRLLKDFRVDWVDLAALTGTQHRATRHGVDKYEVPQQTTRDPADLPLVLHASSGKNYVADGHHRLVAAYLRGEPRARVRIVEIGDLDR